MRDGVSTWPWPSPGFPNKQSIKGKKEFILACLNTTELMFKSRGSTDLCVPDLSRRWIRQCLCFFLPVFLIFFLPVSLFIYSFHASFLFLTFFLPSFLSLYFSPPSFFSYFFFPPFFVSFLPSYLSSSFPSLPSRFSGIYFVKQLCYSLFLPF